MEIEWVFIALLSQGWLLEIVLWKHLEVQLGFK